MESLGVEDIVIRHGTNVPSVNRMEDSAMKITSTVVRIDDALLNELKQVLNEKEIRGFTFAGTYDDLKAIIDEGEFPLMTEHFTLRGLVEAALRGYVDYVQHHGTVPKEPLLPEAASSRERMERLASHEDKAIRLSRDGNLT